MPAVLVRRAVPVEAPLGWLIVPGVTAGGGIIFDRVDILDRTEPPETKIGAPVCCDMVQNDNKPKYSRLVNESSVTPLRPN